MPRLRDRAFLACARNSKESGVAGLQGERRGGRGGGWAWPGTDGRNSLSYSKPTPNQTNKRDKIKI